LERPQHDITFCDHVRPGDVIAWPQGTGEPLGLTRRLIAQRASIAPVGLFVGMMLSSTLKAEYQDCFSIRALGGTGSNRDLAAANAFDPLPVHISDIPALIRTKTIRVDVALVQVCASPVPGHFSLGVVTDYVQEMIRHARVVIAEFNESMPSTGQDALVAKEHIDVLVASDGQLIELPDPPPRESDQAIARIVCSMIPDRATLQFGVGSLPVAIFSGLSHHRGLGIHSGVIFDGAVDLIERGVFTNQYKGVDEGVSVTGCLFGTQRLYRWAHLNPALHMRAIGHTHSAMVLAQLKNFVSINAALEVDLTGQANAETVNGKYVGAVGGQPGFVRGASIALGGRSIIALPSTTPNGKISKIVPVLEATPVTTQRSDIDVIVTEYGAAHLRGQSLAERAKRMIAIAHPKFREDLERRVHATQAWKSVHNIQFSGDRMP